MVRCTGTPTSTFGGGGGTKLFCSQPLKATNANMTIARPEAVAALRVTLPFSLAHIGERVGFIPVPHFILRPRRLSGSEEGFAPSKNSNNLLAVELENEN